MTNIAIFGSGGFAREVAWLAQTHRSAETDQITNLLCFIDDDKSKQDSILNGIPVLSLQDAHKRFPTALIVGGIGSPIIREKTMLRAAAYGFAFGTLIHNTVIRSDFITTGIGCVICAGCILTVNITMGNHVQINLDSTIGHDVALGDFATLAPGVHVSGYVKIGKRVYIGTGANIINGTLEEPLVIADDVTIGAGACVTKSILEPGVTVVGVPAKAIARQPK